MSLRTIIVLASGVVVGAIAWSVIMSSMPGDRGSAAPFTAAERAAAGRMLVDIAVLADSIGERNTRRVVRRLAGS